MVTYLITFTGTSLCVNHSFNICLFITLLFSVIFLFSLNVPLKYLKLKMCFSSDLSISILISSLSLDITITSIFSLFIFILGFSLHNSTRTLSAIWSSCCQFLITAASSIYTKMYFRSFPLINQLSRQFANCKRDIPHYPRSPLLNLNHLFLPTSFLSGLKRFLCMF